jgi:uncharacterized protein YdiU (UPF0061 family)
VPLSLQFDNSYARLGDSYFSRVLPEPAPEPYLVAFNPEAAALIGLRSEDAKDPEFLEVFSGKRQLPEMEPLAMLYSGHQFGVRVPRLGDGRAILLGQAVAPDPLTGPKTWDLHLKGSGQTPYSRQGDGRAVLRSCIREYLCGEAMHGLGIPTTRSLCIVGSREPVQRERLEPRAQLVRMAPSHVRFGSFEYFFYRHHHEPDVQKERLQRLADFVIREYYPELADIPAGPDRYAAWLAEITVRTARLVAAWQSAGWAHGVLNTDNMSILGLTLDYGPFGFMDTFDLGFIPNHSDSSGRYSFGEQPRIGLWNLNQLAQAVLPLMDVPRALEALNRYEPEFHAESGRRLRAKLGLCEEREGADAELLMDLYSAMSAEGLDHTLAFRGLSEGFLQGNGEASLAWNHKYQERLRAENRDFAERRAAMNRVNPIYVLRNHLAQQAIEKAEHGDFSEIERLKRLLDFPFEERPGFEAYAAAPPQSARSIIVSCSS